MEAEGPPETVVADVTAWLLHSFRQLPNRLVEGTGVLRPPAGGDPYGGVSVGVRDPAYWAQDTDALSEALHIAAREDPGARLRAPDIPPAERLTLTVDEAAETLGISRAFAYEAVRRGEIPSIRIGRRVLVPKAALRRMLGVDEDETRPSTTPPEDG